uniref:Uncharacterized protein n=1 Tax=Anguilla anguilla TaxID=7936 RepID=A0A0E9QHQ2_ANGAN
MQKILCGQYTASHFVFLVCLVPKHFSSVNKPILIYVCTAEQCVPTELPRVRYKLM